MGGGSIVVGSSCKKPCGGQSYSGSGCSCCGNFGMKRPTYFVAVSTASEGGCSGCNGGGGSSRYGDRKDSCGAIGFGWLLDCGVELVMLVVFMDMLAAFAG